MTENEFINREINTWGYDTIESMFASGFQPVNVNGVWHWLKAKYVGSGGTTMRPTTEATRSIVD